MTNTETRKSMESEGRPGDFERLMIRPLAIGYARVSTQRQGESGVGLYVQKTAIRAFAEAKDWDLIEIFEDVATGMGENSLRQRTGLRQALTLARKVDAFVIVDNWSRLSRHLASFHDIAKLLPAPECLVSVSDGTSFSEASDAGRLARAEAEGRLIGERTKKKMSELKAKGVVLGNPQIREVQTKGAAAMTAAAEGVIRQIMDVLMTLPGYGVNLSVPKVAEALNGRGITTGHGNLWNATRLRLPLSQAREKLAAELEARARENPLFGSF